MLPTTDKHNLQLGSDTQDRGACSQFAHLYKAPLGQKISQNERRKVFLEALREARNQVVDDNRNLDEIFVEDDEPQQESMEVDRKPHKKKSFRSILTYSEWLHEVPDDLESKWLVKLCPFGHRTLIVAKQNKTLSFNRAGKQMGRFPSLLPSGGPVNPKTNRTTILDCIFNKNTGTYYVLDVIAWNDTFLNLKQCDTEFRFYWIKSKFEENPEYGCTSEINKYSFVLVDYVSAIPGLIRDKLNETLYANDKIINVDGLLFYHKESPYVSGYTPLVMWLKPYMLPEILNVEVDPKYKEHMPKNYTTLQEHLKNVTRFAKMHKKNEEMETESVDKNLGEF